MLKHGVDQLENVVCDYLVTSRRGMRSIRLHHSINTEDSLQQERKQRDTVLPRQVGIDSVELQDVVRAVVRWQGDPGEGDLAATLRQRGQDGVQIATSVLDR